MSQEQILSSNLEPEKMEKKLFISTSLEKEPVIVKYRENQMIFPETHMCLILSYTNHALLGMPY